MKILATNAYTREQKGDSALLSVTLAQLRDAFPEATLTALLMEETVPQDEFEHTPVRPAYAYIALSPLGSTVRRCIRTAFVMADTLMWAACARLTRRPCLFLLTPALKQTAEWYFEADLIVPVGGGYLVGSQGWFGTFNLITTLHSFWLALILGKPIIMYSQSIGPFDNKFQFWLVKHTIRHVRHIFTREPISYAVATHDLAIEGGKVTGSIDGGFAFTGEPGVDLAAVLRQVIAKYDERRPVVGITTKVHLRGMAQQNYERELALFADNLVQKLHCTVVFIPQITAKVGNEDDRIINRRIYEMMRYKDNAGVIEINFNHRQTKTLIEQLDYLVATRFHSVIFALTGGVPALAIAYEYKTQGIMQDLGLTHWVINMPEVTADQLMKLFIELVAERRSYLAAVARVMPEYVGRINRLPELMRQVYTDFLATTTKSK